MRNVMVALPMSVIDNNLTDNRPLRTCYRLKPAVYYASGQCGVCCARCCTPRAQTTSAEARTSIDELIIDMLGNVIPGRTRIELGKLLTGLCTDNVATGRVYAPHWRELSDAYSAVRRNGTMASCEHER